MNKIPLVKWHRSYAYVSSTHMMLPRGLNLTYDDQGGEKALGLSCCTPSSWIPSPPRPTRNLPAASTMPKATNTAPTAKASRDERDLWCNWSEKYINWRQLEILGLMSKGNWA